MGGAGRSSGIMHTSVDLPPKPEHQQQDGRCLLSSDDKKRRLSGAGKVSRPRATANQTRCLHPRLPSRTSTRATTGTTATPSSNALQTNTPFLAINFHPLFIFSIQSTSTPDGNFITTPGYRRRRYQLEYPSDKRRPPGYLTLDLELITAVNGYG
ncbi:hypothetical protein C0J52_10228 [Blattella germanica]|nr:hypothetical protein C0J52_10228 [Blattella germanica]